MSVAIKSCKKNKGIIYKLFLINGLSILRIFSILIIHRVPNAGKGLLNKLNELKWFETIPIIVSNDM